MINIEENKDIKLFTTFKVPALCSYFTEVHSVDELNEALDFADQKHIPLLFLGGGSNMLFTRKFEGMVIKLSLKGIQISEENNDYSIVTVQAGENWHQFVLTCIKNNLGGLENLSLIPGNVGTSPIQNIGAYGVEVKDTLVSLQAFNIETRTVEVFDNPSCMLGYRDSYFKNEGKGRYIILSVSFRLTRHSHLLKISYGAIQEEMEKKGVSEPSIKDVSDVIISIRSSKLPDPQILGNAGSFFKNPTISAGDFVVIKNNYPEIHHYHLPDGNVKIPAGWLIEYAGWKGKKVGEVGVHEKQALVLVNYGQASGSDIFDLSEAIIYDVNKKFNIQLEREVNVII